MTTETGKKPTYEEMLANPDLLPTDTEELMRLVDGEAKADPADTDDATTGDAADVEAKRKADEEAKAKADADAKAKADADAKAKADADAKDKPEGILAKDGKHIIPFATLEASRRREEEERKARESAETARAEAEKRVKELQADLERAQKGGAKDPDAEAKTVALKVKIAALKDQVPEVGEVFDAVMGTVDALTKELGTLRTAHEEGDRRQQDADQREKDAVATRVQDAIDKNPTLRYWQNEKPELFDEAARLDGQLRKSHNEKIQGLSMDARFAKVVEMMETVHGQVELPEGYKPKAAPPSDPAANPKPNQGKDAKVNTEVKAQDKAITLSDLPGGAPPSSGQKALEEMTHGDIQNSVDRMLDKGMDIQDILSSYRG